MHLFAATYATERYCYALPNFGRRVASAIASSDIKKGKFLFIGDEKQKTQDYANTYVKRWLPNKWEFEYHGLDLHDEKLTNYKEDAQLLIAQLQTHAFSLARKERATHLWSIESDVLVQPNALRVSLDMLKFDNGYYDVAMCTYPSQGGGPFLGGRGTKQRQILDDIYLDEREVPKSKLDKIDAIDSNIRKLAEKDTLSKKEDEKIQSLIKQKKKLVEECEKSAPLGNVHTLNGKAWRKRGWMDYAYPGIGKGAVVPTDWIGLGCTLFSEKALQLAHFDGYEGHGTQDLYLCWNRFTPNGLNMCVIPHSPCDHAIRQRNGDDQLWENFVLVNAYHETEGDFVGHLRQNHTKLYNHTAGEKPIKQEKEQDEEQE